MSDYPSLSLNTQLDKRVSFVILPKLMILLAILETGQYDEPSIIIYTSLNFKLPASRDNKEKFFSIRLLLLFIRSRNKIDQLFPKLNSYWCYVRWDTYGNIQLICWAANRDQYEHLLNAIVLLYCLIWSRNIQHYQEVY